MTAIQRIRQFCPAYRQLLVLGLPILAGQLGTVTVGFADNIMVGRYSTDALASASFVNNLFNTAVFALLGFTYGLTPLAGALFGSGQRERIGAMTRNALWLNIVFSLLVTAMMAIVYLFVDRLGQRPTCCRSSGLISCCIWAAWLPWRCSMSWPNGAMPSTTPRCRCG